MAYSYEQILAVDPSNPANVARQASITIFAPGDAAKTPLTLTDTNGQPLPNPLTVNANGFGPAFIHATLDRVAWEGGGFTGFLTSYEGMREEAQAARQAAETAAATAGAEAGAVADAAVAAALADADAALAAAQAALDAATAPTDNAISTAISNEGSATRTALNAAIVGLHTQNVTGPQTIPVISGHTYELTATGNTVVTLTGEPGAQIALVVDPVTFTVTIEGNAVTEGTFVGHKISTGWVLHPVGGGTIGDTTAPTAGTLGVSVGETTATLTVTGAMDETALHTDAYRYSKDGGTTWTAWMIPATYQYTGLTAGTSYTFRHEVRDAALNTKLGTPVTISTTAAPVWTTVFTDAFTGVADGTALAGRTTETGALTYHTSTTATVTGQRAYNGTHGATTFVVIPKTASTSVRLSGAYDVGTVSGSNGALAIGFTTNGTYNNYFNFVISHASGTATVSFSELAAGVWTGSIPTATGHPKTGTFELTYNPVGRSGTLKLNGTQVGTFSGDTTLNPTGFYAYMQNNFAGLDTLKGEVSSV